MTGIKNNCFSKQPQRIISALVLTSILSLSIELSLVQNATAAPGELYQPTANETAQSEDDSLPTAVAEAVLQDASERSNLPISALRIVEAEPREWPDGCLGLGGADVVCTTVIVPGYLVTVAAGQQRLVYRTDTSGRNIRFDQAASRTSDTSTPKPVQIPQSELSPPLQPKVIFRVITTGGFAGITTETNLFKDGQVVQMQANSNGSTAQTWTYQVSRQQVRQFQQLLKQQQFSQFKSLEYPPPSNAADYFTVTLTSRAGTTRYADINQENLPNSLQTVIQAWEQLLNRR